MATSILATGTTASSSSDTTFTSDTLVSLKGPPEADAKVVVASKDDGGAYNVIGALTQDKPSGILAAGTYRFTRIAGPSCGVYSA